MNEHNGIPEKIADVVREGLTDLLEHATGIARQLITIAVIAVLVMFLWDFTLPDLAGVHQITYLKSLALVFGIRLLMSQRKIEFLPALTAEEIEYLREEEEKKKRDHLRVVTNGDEE